MHKKILQEGDQKSTQAVFDGVLSDIFSTSSKEWSTISGKRMMDAFKEAYKHVPAYTDFITKSGVGIPKTFSDGAFQKLPPVTKKNYLRAYPWQDLSKKNSLSKKALVMTSTSGSTGEPFYFPRTKTIDIQSSVCHQLFLQTSTIPKNKSILVINCFGMGVWIGGLITYQAFKYVAERGYPLTLITPGINKQEIFKALKHIGPSYDHIILCGYPPFIKDIVDEAKDAGIEWNNFSLSIIFAAESFSETFREYIVEKTGIKNLYRDTMNIYGSADLGTMAQETPVSVFVRKLALSNKNLYVRIFGQATRLPTLAQYIPSFINFETKNGTLLCTGDNIMPLIRYDIGDNGSTLTYKEVEDACLAEGIVLADALKREGLLDTKTELPFVFVYERADFSASFYGALIYPEFIKHALSDKKFHSLLTGKFTMCTKNDTHENQYLEINIELKQDQKVTPSLRKEILQSVCDTLCVQSAEYKKITESLGKRAVPKVIFWPHASPAHFTVGAKQRWIKK